MTDRLHALEMSVRGMTLRGTGYTPAGGGPFGVVVLHHGFGSNRIEASRAFVRLANTLVDRGMAVVAMDRAGHGESDGEFTDITVSQEVADCIEVVDRVAELAWVDADDLHLVGLSLGAVIASIVAAETAHDVRSLTLWSVAALFVDEINEGHLQGLPIDERDESGNFDFRGLRLGPAFFDDARSFDVYGRARAYRGPVRILHGEEDFIPASYAARYEDVYGDALRYTLVPGADHCWESIPARDLVIAETVDFVTAHADGVGAGSHRRPADTIR